VRLKADKIDRMEEELKKWKQKNTKNKNGHAQKCRQKVRQLVESVLKKKKKK